ncbi:MAG: hypothetical protein Q3972_03985 [Corynebacterium sp.]|nr:hypothetical protein [Corynebacterium sp.]
MPKFKNLAVAMTMATSLMVAPAAADAATVTANPSLLVKGECTYAWDINEMDSLRAAASFAHAQNSFILIRDRINDPGVRDQVVAWARAMNDVMNEVGVIDNSDSLWYYYDRVADPEKNLMANLGVSNPGELISEWVLRIHPDNPTGYHPLFKWYNRRWAAAGTVSTAGGWSEEPNLAAPGFETIQRYWQTVGNACGTLRARVLPGEAVVYIDPAIQKWSNKEYNDWRGLNLIRDVFNLVGINNQRLNDRIAGLDAWGNDYGHQMDGASGLYGTAVQYNPYLLWPGGTEFARKLGLNSGLFMVAGVGAILAVVIKLINNKIDAAKEQAVTVTVSSTAESSTSESTAENTAGSEAAEPSTEASTEPQS